MNVLEILLKARNETQASFAQLEKSVDHVKKQTESLAAAQNTSAASGLKFGAAVGVGFAAVQQFLPAIKEVVGVVNDSVKAFASASSAIADLRKQTGYGAEAIQVLQYAAKQAGVENGTLTQSLVLMEKAAAKTPEKFAQLGVSLADLKKNDPVELMSKMSAALKGISDENERTRITMDLFGRSGLQMLKLLMDDFDGLADAAHGSGLMTDEMVERGDRLDDAMSRLDTTLDNLQKNLGAAFASEGMLSAMETMGTLIGVMAQNADKLYGAFKLFGGAVGMMLQGVESLGEAMKMLDRSKFMDYEEGKPGKSSAAAHARLFGWNVPTEAGKGTSGAGEFEDVFSASYSPSSLKAAKASEAMRKQMARDSEQSSRELEKRRAEDQKFMEQDAALWKAFYTDLTQMRWKAEKAALDEADRRTADTLPGLQKMADGWLKDALDLKGEQDSAEYGYGQVTKIKDAQEMAAESAARWAGALQGVALVAGSIGGKLGDTLSVMANIGKSFEGLSKLTGEAKKTATFNAIAGGVGQIGGLVGGTAGAGIQGGAGGAMLGQSLASALKIAGPWGAIAGGAIGMLGGLFGASSAQKKELADTKKQLEGLSETAKTFGIDLTKAFSSKSVTEVKQAISDVGKAVEDQKKRLAGLDVAGGGLNAFTEGGGLSDAASVDRGGLYAGAIFGGMVKETGDVVGALKAIGPALAEMSTKAAEFGVSLSPGVSNLLGMNDVISKNEGLADQVSGLNSMMKGLGDAGMVTKDLFAAFGADTSAVFARLVEGGATGNQALSLMQPTLQQLYEGQKLHGFAVDQTTQGLIDQAKAEGIVGDQFMSANERIVELLGIIAEVLGAKLPEAYGKAGDAAEEYGRRATKSAPKFPTGGGINPGGGDPEDSGLGFAGGTGFRNFGSGTRVTLHGDEAVLTRPQADRLVGMAVAGVSGSYQPTTGGGGGIQIGEVHVHANDAQGGKEAADAFLARIAEALDQGGPGATRFRTAQGGRSNL